eukprot:g326.t1
MQQHKVDLLALQAEMDKRDAAQQRRIDMLQTQRQLDMLQTQRRVDMLQTQRRVDMLQTQRRIDLMKAERDKKDMAMAMQCEIDRMKADQKERELQHQLQLERQERKAMEERLTAQYPGQFEIRTALANKKVMVLIRKLELASHFAHPSVLPSVCAAYTNPTTSYDFYAEQMAAPDDLKFLTDQHESMAFRRRGYERDALLRAVIDRAGFQDLVESEEAERGQAQQLATLPEELSHFNLDNFRDREVQADLVALLLLPKGDPSFTSCILVHGMGGTGKTVTAVAVLQQVSVRDFFSDVYWVAVGADAVGERMKELMCTLHKQLTGKSLSSEDAKAKNEQDLQQMLVQAMGEKRRALVVLDDPWLPEQVRLLNPIDGSHTQHRLLITTRMRDLATRVELPLMREEEAVALLMDLANVEEASYLKDSPGSAWPPQAAFAISAECGLLPITLLIAAQVIRSWGSGWVTLGYMFSIETAVLPLLREERGSGTSTVEERVIGAGLQALEKNEDGPAVKKLFYAFAEDYVHPIAVVELLWRSCCASESEKQQNSLVARLKVRQRTQLLVDHSLLLGSSSEGVHLHDIVLQYLRKRLSPEELRELHANVFDGMVAESQQRMATTGRGLEDARSAFEGEEVDHYAGCIGPFHVKCARDRFVGLVDDELVQRWLLCNDRALVQATAVAVGLEDLQKLGEHFSSEAAWLKKAKIELATVGLLTGIMSAEALAHAKAALTALKRSRLATEEAKQLEVDILMVMLPSITGGPNTGDDFNESVARINELRAANSTLRIDEFSWTIWTVWPRMFFLAGFFPQSWNDGTVVTEQTIFEAAQLECHEAQPLMRQAVQQSTGIRHEVMNIVNLCVSYWWPLSQSERTTALWKPFYDTLFGADGLKFIEAVEKYAFAKHFAAQRNATIDGPDVRGTAGGT